MKKKRYGRGEFYAGNHIKLTEENNKQHFSRNFKAFSGKKNKLNEDNSEDKVYDGDTKEYGNYDGDTEEYGNMDHKFNDEIKTFNISGHNNSIKINGNVKSIHVSGHNNSIKVY